MRIFTTGWELGHYSVSGQPFRVFDCSGVSGDTAYMGTVARGRRTGKAFDVRCFYGVNAWAEIETLPLDEFYMRIWIYYQTGSNLARDTEWSASRRKLIWWVGPAGVVGALCLRTNGQFSFSDGNGLLLDSATTAILPNKWSMLQLHWQSAFAGRIQLKVNGIDAIADQQAITDIGNGHITQFRFGMHTNGTFADPTWPRDTEFLFDDLAIDDASMPDDGHTSNLPPYDDGYLTEFNGSDGNQTDNWRLVNDSPILTNSYITTNTAGKRDAYLNETFTNISPLMTDATIEGLSVVAYAQGNNVGYDQLKGFVKGSVTEEVSSAQVLSPSWRTHRFSVGGSWVPDDIDSTQFGVESV